MHWIGTDYERHAQPAAHLTSFVDGGLQIVHGFRSRGIEIPFPQRQVTLLQGTRRI